MTGKVQSKLSKEERYILYALGKSYQSFNRQFSNKPLEVSISKVVFIDLLISSNSVNKKERAIYKNLKALGSKRFIKYKEKELSFTKKGFREFKKVDENIVNYVELINHIQNPRTISIHKKIQTKLKQ